MLPFLSADWRTLALLNYAVDPELLRPFVPRGVELDSWRGIHFVSLVGFLFRRTRVFGVPVPLHGEFEEVNLRFYVVRRAAGGDRHGVTFLREIVAPPAVALGAKVSYNEPYVVRSTRRALRFDAADAPRHVEYGWGPAHAACTIDVETTGDGALPASGSQEEFLSARHWGYTRQRDGGTIEYEVPHARWRVWASASATLTGSLEDVFPGEFASVLGAPPASAFVAEGSGVTVSLPRRIAFGSSTREEQ